MHEDIFSAGFKRSVAGLLVVACAGLVLVASWLVSRNAYALGLGQLEVDSMLNQTFSGRITLISPQAGELDSLRVYLADHASFRRAGIERGLDLSRLRFELIRPETTEAGPDHIKVSSTRPIQEPVLNFVLEVSWEQGRIQREYSVLLDPPVKLRPSEPRSARVQEAADWATRKVVADTDVMEEDYGPVQRGETLWGIAERMRPQGVSVGQMMMALLRVNPDAFADANINNLKRGAILRMPSRSEMEQINSMQAQTAVRQQNMDWGGVTPMPSRPESVVVPDTARAEDMQKRAPAPRPTETEAELRVVAPTDETPGSAIGAQGGVSGTQSVAEMEKRLTLALETMEAVKQENNELRERLLEAEQLSQDQHALIELKDQNLAALQEMLAAQGDGKEMPTEDMPEMMEEAAMEPEMMEEAAMEPEMMEEAAMEPEMMEEAAVEPEMMEEAAVEPEMMEEAAVEPEMMEEAAVEPEMMEEAAVGLEEDSGVSGLLMSWLDQAKTFLLSFRESGLLWPVVGGLAVLLIGLSVVYWVRNRPRRLHFEEDDMEGLLSPTTASVQQETVDMGDAAWAEDETQMPGTGDTAEMAAASVPVADSHVLEMTPEPDFGEEEADDDDEDEALRDVDTYLAFEQYDQAEQAVRGAIEQQPEQLDFHVKLLEVFFTAGERRKYEEEARVLNDLVDGQGEHWDMALAMWSEMSSTPLFEGGGEEEEQGEVASAASGGMVDLTAAVEGEEAEGLDIDFSSAGEVVDISGSDEGVSDEGASDEGLDFDLGDVGVEGEAEDAVEGEAALELEVAVEGEGEEGEDEGLDFDLGDVGMEGEAEDAVEGEAALELEVAVEGEGEEGEDEGLDFDLGDVGVEGEAEDAVEGEAALEVAVEGEGEEGEDEELDFDLGDLGLEGDSAAVKEEEDESSMEGAADILELGGGDEEDSTTEGGGITLLDGADYETDGEENLLDITAVGDADEFGKALEEPETAEDAFSAEGMEQEALDTGATVIDFDQGAKPEQEISDTTVEEEQDIQEEELVGAETTADGVWDDDNTLKISAGGPSVSEVFEEEVEEEADVDAEVEALVGDTLNMMAEPEEDTLDDGDEEGLSLLDDEGMEDDAKQEGEQEKTWMMATTDDEMESVEDEIATKLDLARAYVELGEEESARVSLEEIIRDGNEEQKKRAEELLAKL